MPPTEGLRAGDDWAPRRRLTLRDQLASRRRLADSAAGRWWSTSIPPTTRPDVRSRAKSSATWTSISRHSIARWSGSASIRSNLIGPSPKSMPFPSLCSRIPRANWRGPLACSQRRVAERSTFVVDRDQRVAPSLPRRHTARPCPAGARLRSLDARIASNARRLRPSRVSSGPEMMVILCSSAIDDK